jgi:hypothetical protein
MACVTEKQPSRKHGVSACIAVDLSLSLHISILFIQHTTPTSKLNSKLKMPQSRELTNKKNVQKDRQSRGRAGSDVTNAKKGMFERARAIRPGC